MISKDDKKLLLSIKFMPFIIMCVIAILGTIVALYINQVNFDKEIDKVKSLYLKNEKQVIKQEVLKIRNNIYNEQKLTEEKLKKNIKEKVTNAYAIVSNLYEQNKHKSKKEILKLSTDALRNVHFNDNRGYFFMYDMKGTALLLPPRKELEGTNFLNFQDIKGAFTVRDMRDLTLQNGEGFYTWWWYKPNEKKQQSKKIGFAKYFAPLNCFIGTGEYFEDYEESIKRSITKRLSLYTYGKNYYIFIFDKNGTLISHQNTNLIGTQSVVYNGVIKDEFLSDLFKMQEDDGMFYQYLYSKTKIGKDINKVSYLLPHKKWEWTIGSGFYTDDLNSIVQKKKEELTKKNHENTINIIMVFFLLLVIVIIFSFMMSYMIERRFEHYKRRVEEKDQLLAQQSKMAAMGEMIENIAHQWRQPLSIISTASSGLKVQQEFDMMTEDILRNGLDNISESVDYLSTTIDDFRNFYKKDKIKKLFNISQTIQKTISLLHSKFKKHNIELIMENSEIEYLGFQNELIQVFMNILSNARDVLKESNLEKKLIFIDISKIEDGIQISFYDNGNGIDEKIIDKLFDYKFTTKSHKNGSGVGLYMSKLIIEKSGGTITVSNKEYEYEKKKYRGAEFVIILKNQLNVLEK